MTPYRIVFAVFIVCVFAGVAAALNLLAPASTAAGAAWAATAKGHIAGTLTFSRRRPKKPIVVYLERKDAALAFDPPQKNTVIRQKNARFWPSFLVVVAGQTVTFNNDEVAEIDHNVYSLGAEAWNLGLFPQGEQRSQTFKHTGELKIHCSIHRMMNARIFVAPNPAYTIVGGKESKYKISNVPVGQYVLRTYQRAKRFRNVALPITVIAGETLSVNVEMKR